MFSATILDVRGSVGLLSTSSFSPYHFWRLRLAGCGTRSCCPFVHCVVQVLISDFSGLFVVIVARKLSLSAVDSVVVVTRSVNDSVLISWNDVVECTVSVQQMKISADTLLKRFSSWFSLCVKESYTTAFELVGTTAFWIDSAEAFFSCFSRWLQ
ncbi:hypothetical protein F511_31276 [Dorcoceras hygrometricum]|uniref:Uncharacterized protein n=1 Tax=Dorcoceras hygrometricum TaxID=472368 RepID=A0A2Z7AN17_9LAMI|nr:hypothetical protein F511_31276 [Dorcoceras hygrometricum]